MTHEELLAKIATPNEFIGVKYAPDWQSAALRAVVELHNSVTVISIDENIRTICEECTNQDMGVEDKDLAEVPYPCPTIKVIEEHLQ